EANQERHQPTGHAGHQGRSLVWRRAHRLAGSGRCSPEGTRLTGHAASAGNPRGVSPGLKRRADRGKRIAGGSLLRSGKSIWAVPSLVTSTGLLSVTGSL